MPPRRTLAKKPPADPLAPPPYQEAGKQSAHDKTLENVVIIGDHSDGKVASSLAKLLVLHSFTVTSVIHEDSQASHITKLGATPHVLSLKDPTALTALFKKTEAQLIYFAAAEGDRAEHESMHKAAYEDALNVFDAMEAMKEEKKPHLILMSSIDTRNPDNPEFPSHYNEADKALSAKNHAAMKPYFKWRYEIDKNLIAREAFHWTILRPGELIDEPGSGHVEVGRTHLKDIARDDVAMALLELASRPKAHALALDVVGGKTPVREALDLAIKQGKTDFLD